MFYEIAVCNAVVAFLAYYNTLYADFTYDDAIAVVKNKDVHGETPISQIFFHDFWGISLTHPGSHKSYRPLCIISYRLNHMVGGLNPFGYHLLNILFHCIVSYLVTITANRLFRKFVPTLLAGLFFALHPIHTEAVAGIVGRADVGACLFFLLSFNCYITYCVNRDLYLNRKQHIYLVLSVVFAAASMLTKEQGITVLGVNIVFDILHQGQTMKWDHLEKVVKRIRSNINGIIIQVVSGVALLILRVSLMGGAPPAFAPSDNPAAKYDDIFTRTSTFLYLPVFNFGLLLAPIYLCFDWSMDAIPLIESFFDLRNVATFLFYFVLIPSFLLGLNREVEIERMFMTMFGDLPHENDVYAKSKNDTNAKSNGANSNYNKKNVKFYDEKIKRTKGVRRRLIPSTKNIKPTLRTNHQNGHGDVSSTDFDIIPHFLVVITSIAFMVLPFIPALNLFFYVGFVVAERILYIPSVGYCILLALGFNQLYVQYSRWYSYVPNHIMTWFYKILFYGGLILMLSLFACKTHLRNYDWESDEKLFSSGTTINPAKAWSNLGSALKVRGRVHEAEHAYREALKYRADWTDAHYNLGILLMDMGKLDDAVTQYLLAADHSPKNAMVHLNLGYTLNLLNRKKEAEDKFRYVATLDNKHSRNPHQQLTGIISALGYLGKIQLEQSRYEEAVRSFEEALRRRPSNYEATSIYNMLGESYYKLLDYSNAERCYKTSLEYNPRISRTHLAYAMLLNATNQLSDADYHFKQSLQLDPSPKNFHTYNFYNDFLVQQNRIIDAVLMLKEGVKLLPDNYRVYFDLATNLRTLNRLKEAERYYRKIVSLRPNLATAHRDFAAILHMNGKHDEAMPYYKKAFQLDPNDPMTRENLEINKKKLEAKKLAKVNE